MPEVLRDVLIEEHEKYPLIGVSPQFSKVYKHTNRTPIAVKQKYNNITIIFGRPLLDYEKTNYPTIDLEAIQIRL